MSRAFSGATACRCLAFGGTRASATNDKAGSWLNLERWISPRAIKETFLPPQDFRYPYMGKE